MIKKLVILFFLFFSCKPTNNSVKKNDNSNFSIVIHGGAGTMSKSSMSEEIREQYINKLDEAVTVGYEKMDEQVKKQSKKQ